MNTAITEALNGQIRMEFGAAFLYLSFSIDLHHYGLPGSGRWMRRQYEEECRHALLLVDYMEKRGVRAAVPVVQTPRYEWKNPVDLFRLALAHERSVSESIDALAALCDEKRDYATKEMVSGFVREQVEEENSVSDIVRTLTLCGGCVDALLGLDDRLGKR